MLSAEELLAGSNLTYEVEVPQHVLSPAAGQRSPLSAGDTGKARPPSDGAGARKVRLRPLNVRDLQLISHAAKEKDTLMATLMVQRALVEPEMSVAQAAALHAGLVQYLLDHVNRISGITASAELLSEALEAPLTKAAFILTREFGWTPQQISELTFGQMLVHLKLLAERK